MPHPRRIRNAKRPTRRIRNLSTLKPNLKMRKKVPLQHRRKSRSFDNRQQSRRSFMTAFSARSPRPTICASA